MKSEKFASIEIPDGVDVRGCCAKESSRYAINGVLCGTVKTGSGKDDWAGLAVATDGRTLSVTECAVVVGGKGKGIVPPSLLPGMAGTRVHERNVRLNGKAERDTRKGTISAEFQEGSFPPVRDALPDESALFDGNDYLCCAFNPDLLSNAIKAVTDFGAIRGNEEYAIYVHKEGKKPAVVIGQHGIALVMPVARPTTTATVRPMFAKMLARVKAFCG